MRIDLMGIDEKWLEKSKCEGFVEKGGVDIVNELNGRKIIDNDEVLKKEERRKKMKDGKRKRKWEGEGDDEGRNRNIDREVKVEEGVKNKEW